jgi:hypothetical protein
MVSLNLSADALYDAALARSAAIPWLMPVAVVSIAVIAGVRVWDHACDQVARASRVVAWAVTSVVVLRSPNVGATTVIIWATILGIEVAGFQALRELRNDRTMEHPTPESEV